MKSSSSRLLLHVKAALSLIGLAIAFYLVLSEPGPGQKIAFVCPGQSSSSSLINCSAVLTSRYSRILGVPLSVWAFSWFAVLFALVLLQRKNAMFGMLSACFSITGVFAVLYSLLAMFSIGHVCVYCSAIDAILVVIFVIGILELRALLDSILRAS